MKLIKSIIIVALIAGSSFTAMAQQKFGIVMSQDLLLKMPGIDSVGTKLEAIQQSLISEMGANEKEYTSKMQDFQKNSSTYSETMRAQKEKEIQGILQRMQEFEQVARQELEQQQQILMKPIQERLFAAIAKVGKDGGFVFIFDKSSPLPVLYSSESLVVDVTPLVRTEIGIK